MISIKGIKEWLLFSFLLLKDFLSTRQTSVFQKLRERCDDSNVYVGIHEWGGYELVRSKNVPLINSFTCGLKYQLERFNEYNGQRNINIIVTMSDVYRHKNVMYVKERCNEFVETSNEGMDFAGYAAVYEKLKDYKNAYVILTNSSVNSQKYDFIDDYISYMNNQKDVGMLGISYNSKCYQTFIRNNFTPHLQSFFLLTTIGVLRQVVEYNKGKFPGSNISNKRLLIREGEIKLSQIVLALGYKLAVVQEDGIYKFDNDHSKWSLKIGDGRIGVLHPNTIWAINKKGA